MIFIFYKLRLSTTRSASIYCNLMIFAALLYYTDNFTGVFVARKATFAKNLALYLYTLSFQNEHYLLPSAKQPDWMYQNYGQIE